jgi:hypothetical protein
VPANFGRRPLQLHAFIQLIQCKPYTFIIARSGKGEFRNVIKASGKTEDSQEKQRREREGEHHLGPML